MLTKKRKENIIKKTGRHDKDTGSPEVQIAILTRRIDDLTSHLKKNRKDKHARRGLLQLVANRHVHLGYLKKHDEPRYKKVTKELGLK